MNTFARVTPGNKSGDCESNYETPQEDGEDVFSDSRETAGDDTTTTTTTTDTDGFEADTRSASADTARDATVGRPVSANERPTTSPSSRLGDGGGSWGGRQGGGVARAGLDEEEWCAGHVCLRLRPHGLRESRERGQEETGAEGSEESSSDGSGAESEELREFEVRRRATTLCPLQIKRAGGLPTEQNA